MRRLFTLILVLTFGLAACTDSSGSTTSTTTLDGSPTTTTLQTGSTNGDTTTTTTAGTTTTTAEVVIEGSGQNFDQLIAITEDLRGMDFITKPVVTVLDEVALAGRVAELIEEDLDRDELAIDEALLRTMGLLSDDIDLFDALTALYAEQVAGFYDGETGELVVSGDAELTPLTKTIVIHELIHALTDQHFDFDPVFRALDDAERYEEASALQALVEGDATYFQLVYLQEYLSQEEQIQAITESFAADTTVLDSLPDWFGSDLAFPYDAGFLFVERLVQDAGIVGINQAYERLPTTTEQIIEPTRYLALEAGIEVGMPPTSLAGYEVTEEGVWGQWAIDNLLLDGLPAGDRLVASSGWGGDHYRVLWNGSDVAMVMYYEGDTPRDAEEFVRALRRSLPAAMDVGGAQQFEGGVAYVDGDFLWTQWEDRRVALVIASDPDTGRSLSGLLRLTP